MDRIVSFPTQKPLLSTHGSFMEDLIDLLLSHTWLVTILFTIAIFASVGIWLTPRFQPNRFLLLKVVISLALLGPAFYLMFGPAGYAVDFTDADFYGDKAVVLEEHYSGDGDGGSYQENRIYVIDLTTGKRLLRKSVEYTKLLFVNEQGAFVDEYQKGVLLYNLTDWKVLKTWNKETGFEQFPELQSGINQISSWNGNSATQHVLQITTQKGRVYYFDLRTQQLSETAPKRNYQSTFSDSYLNLREAPAKAYYSFVRTTGEILHLQMQKTNESKPTEFAQDFLDPDFVAFDSAQNLFIVRHFETLERKTILLTAFDADLHKKWEVHQSALFPALEPRNDAKNIVLFVGKNLWVSLGGFTALLKAKNGEVIWANRF